MTPPPPNIWNESRGKDGTAEENQGIVSRRKVTGMDGLSGKTH